MSLTRPRAVPLPHDSGIHAMDARPDLADAYAIDLPPGTARSPEVLARFVFEHAPRWISVLMAIRDTLVAGFGLKTARGLRSDKTGDGARIGLFKVYAASALEVLMGEDDRHLDFRVSALVRPATAAGAGHAQLVVSSVVHCHNRLGRTYLALIAPFHRRVVQASLRRAARLGWPREDGITAPPVPDGVVV